MNTDEVQKKTSSLNSRSKRINDLMTKKEETKKIKAFREDETKVINVIPRLDTA